MLAYILQTKSKKKKNDAREKGALTPEGQFGFRNLLNAPPGPKLFAG
jgi:hypothetical protein